MIRGCPNGETHPVEDRGFRVIGRLTQGTETSKYLQEEKTIVIPKVVASELGRVQTSVVKARLGL